MRTTALVYWLALATLPLAAPGVRTEPQDSAERLLRSVRTLRCDFPDGNYVNLAESPPKWQQAEGPMGVVYDAIDRTQGRARLIGTVGTGDMIVIEGVNTLTLIEMTPAMTPMVTVVYGQYRSGTRGLLAVQSRHFGHHGGLETVISVGQYYGTCHRFE